MRNKFSIKGLVTFNKSGNSSKSKSGRLTIPKDVLKYMQISEDERIVDITYLDDGKICIAKSKDNNSQK